MVAVEVGNEYFLDLTEFDVWDDGAEALELVLGTFADIDEKGRRGWKEDSEGGLVASGGGDCRGGTEGNYCNLGGHIERQRRMYVVVVGGSGLSRLRCPDAEMF